MDERGRARQTESDTTKGVGQRLQRVSFLVCEPFPSSQPAQYLGINPYRRPQISTHLAYIPIDTQMVRNMPGRARPSAGQTRATPIRSYATKEEAAECYDLSEIMVEGPKAITNFVIQR